MKKTISLFLAALLISLGGFAGQAYALDINTAKQQGLIGEKVNGMIGAISHNPSPEVIELVESTNKARAQVYAEMAKKQNLTLGQVRSIAAQKIMEKAAPGDYIEVNGEWSVKQAKRN